MERCRFDNCRGSVRFTRCGLQGTSFASANLKDVGVVGCNARQASFRGAVLQDLRVFSSDLGRCDFTLSRLRGVRFSQLTGDDGIRFHWARVLRPSFGDMQVGQI